MNKSDFTFLKEDDEYLVLHTGSAIGRIKRWGRCGWSIFLGLNQPVFKNINGKMEDAAEILVKHKKCATCKWNEEDNTPGYIKCDECCEPRGVSQWQPIEVNRDKEAQKSGYWDDEHYRSEQQAAYSDGQL